LNDDDDDDGIPSQIKPSESFSKKIFHRYFPF
jgi:hypothetical protein